MTPKERAHHDAGIKCKLANERFGLIEGMRILLDSFNCNDVADEYIIKLARERDLDKLKDFMLHVGTKESGMPRHTRIRNPSSVNGMY